LVNYRLGGETLIQRTRTTPWRILAIDDDEALLRALGSIAPSPADDLRCCGDVRAAIALLRTWTPDVVLLDFTLPDGSAYDVLGALSAMAAVPHVVIMTGTAGPLDSFRLARLGAGAFLSKPFTRDELWRAIEQAVDASVDLRPFVRSLVGKRPVRDVESEIRGTMLAEALGKANGNRRRAARLLDVSRQLLQHMIRRHPA
jgi:DNA-binding NtrC family response regulator